MTIGFIGFGEAASCIAQGLHQEGVERILCYDMMQDDPKVEESFNKKYTACGGEKMPSAADVCRNADLVISAVPSNYAVSAAKNALEGIGPNLLFLDVSTATPAEKREISDMVEKRGALCADGAMLGALLKDKHQVPMLLSGNGAIAVKERLAPYHMRLEVVAGAPGVATGMKFIRSITAKGISCLLIESLQAGQHFGIEQAIVDSFLDSYGPGFIEIINGYVSGAVIHAERREHEMQNVVDFLKSESLPHTMAEASRQKLQWLNKNKIKDNFSAGVPRNWDGVLDGWKL